MHRFARDTSLGILNYFTENLALVWKTFSSLWKFSTTSENFFKMFDCVFIFISYTMKSALKKKAYKIEFIEFHTRCTCKIITECHFNRRNEIIPNSQGILPKKEIFQKWQYSNRVIQAELEDRPKSYSCSDQGYVWQIFPQTTSSDEVDTVCYMVKWRWKKRIIILSGVSLKHTQNNLKSFFFFIFQFEV